ncbi:uncharacterized protein LOC141785703 [Halichoeres trimaculatus]|uniref:uncharacterized protein LOC141785703 n=1 Tax=Halichoeres trimaculatus TaxID=147232 RepID=UPI003D9F360D
MRVVEKDGVSVVERASESGRCESDRVPTCSGGSGAGAEQSSVPRCPSASLARRTLCAGRLSPRVLSFVGLRALGGFALPGSELAGAGAARAVATWAGAPWAGAQGGSLFLSTPQTPPAPPSTQLRPLGQRGRAHLRSSAACWEDPRPRPAPHSNSHRHLKVPHNTTTPPDDSANTHCQRRRRRLEQLHLVDNPHRYNFTKDPPQTTTPTIPCHNTHQVAPNHPVAIPAMATSHSTHLMHTRLSLCVSGPTHSLTHSVSHTQDNFTHFHHTLHICQHQ